MYSIPSIRDDFNVFLPLSVELCGIALLHCHRIPQEASALAFSVREVYISPQSLFLRLAVLIINRSGARIPDIEVVLF